MSVIPYKIEIELAEQIITIKPNDGVDLLVLSATELGGEVSPSIYLDRKEMELLIQKMTEMMEYINPESIPEGLKPGDDKESFRWTC